MFEVGDYVIVVDEYNPFVYECGMVIKVNSPMIKVDLDEDFKQWFEESQLEKLTEEEYQQALKTEATIAKYMAEFNKFEDELEAYLDSLKKYDSDYPSSLINNKAEDSKQNQLKISKRTKDLCKSIQSKNKISWAGYFDNMYSIKMEIDAILDFIIDAEAEEKIDKLKKHHDYLLNKLDNLQKVNYNKYCKRKFTSKMKRIGEEIERNL